MKTTIEGISVFNIMSHRRRNGNQKKAGQNPTRSDGDLQVSVTELPDKKNNRYYKEWQDDLPRRS